MGEAAAVDAVPVLIAHVRAPEKNEHERAGLDLLHVLAAVDAEIGAAERQFLAREHALEHAHGFEFVLEHRALALAAAHELDLGHIDDLCGEDQVGTCDGVFEGKIAEPLLAGRSVGDCGEKGETQNERKFFHGVKSFAEKRGGGCQNDAKEV